MERLHSKLGFSLLSVTFTCFDKQTAESVTFYSSGANVIKLYTAVSKFFNKLVFVPCKVFQDSIVFTGKAGAYQSEAPLRCSAQFGNKFLSFLSRI
jgi:hypothetical protein